MAIYTAEDNTQIYFEEHGKSAERPQLLLLPGLLGAVQTHWRNFLDELANEFSIVLTDLRGHGQSGNNSDELRTERMVRDIAGLLDYLEIEQTHIAGYSLGGYIGMQLEHMQPGRVLTLLMHATKFYWTPEAVDGMRRQMNPEKIEVKVPKYAAQLAAEHGENRWRALMTEAVGLVEAVATGGLNDDDAGKIHIPVLVSVGDSDELIPVEEALRLSRTLTHGALQVIPRVKHPFPKVPRIPFIPSMSQFHSLAQ